MPVTIRGCLLIVQNRFFLVQTIAVHMVSVKHRRVNVNVTVHGLAWTVRFLMYFVQTIVAVYLTGYVIMIQVDVIANQVIPVWIVAL